MVSTATWIETYTGRHVDILDPDPNEIVIEDIAHALANTNRFGGHTQVPYSVAEHSLRMSYIVPPELALEALMHDAQEAFVGDMPSPFKKVMPEFQGLEDSMEAAIRAAFGLPGQKHSPEIKYYDDQMLVTEARDLGLSWWNSDKHTQMPPPLREKIVPAGWKTVRYAFIERFNELTADKLP